MSHHLFGVPRATSNPGSLKKVPSEVETCAVAGQSIAVPHSAGERKVVQPYNPVGIQVMVDCVSWRLQLETARHQKVILVVDCTILYQAMTNKIGNHGMLQRICSAYQVIQ